jgi:hypothetical protein
LSQVLGLKKRISFTWSVLVAVILFIPSCIGVMEILDQLRYGTFSYNDPEEIRNRRIRHWIPPTAESITVHKTSRGHLARFKINKNALMEWLPQIRKESEVSQIQEATPMDKECSASQFGERFKEVGWKHPKDSVEYHVILRSNGAGFTIWYSEALGIAYLAAGYW